jgi:tetratricopeptide (TPR) repeat protein
LGDLRRAGEALATQGRVLFWTGEAERADDAFQRAIRMLESRDPSPELAKTLTWASALKITTGVTDEGAALASRGLSMDPSLLSTGTRSSLLTTWGTCQVFMGRLEGLASIRTALELAEQSGEAEARARAYINLVLCLSELVEAEALEVARQGRQLMRRIGATSFEEGLAGKEAWILAGLGRYAEAEEICREVLATKRSVRVVPGYLFSGLTLAQITMRQGRSTEAREILDDLFPHARLMGGAMFLAPAFALEAELEWARGNQASARLSASEAFALALETSSLLHAAVTLVPSARILGGEVKLLLDRLAAIDPHPALEARRNEARAILDADPALFAAAAELYGSLQLPYEEARCRLESGEPDRAAELIDGFGLQHGPLGARLADLTTS